MALAGAPTAHAESRRTIDDDFDAQHLGELVVHLDPVTLVAVFDAPALTLFFQIGEDFIDAGMRALAAQVAQDVLAGKVQGGMLEQTPVQTGQSVRIGEEDVQSEFRLVDDPVVRKSFEEVAEQGIATFG